MTASPVFPPDPPEDRLPAEYRLPAGSERGPEAPTPPQVVFIEVTNHCNLRCQTCPRTYLTLEPPRSLSFEQFTRIARAFPVMRRAVLHGIGEPLLNRDLPRMIAYLKARGVTVLFNSNGTLLSSERSEALVRSGLDEFRCSIDGASPETYARIRGAPLLPKVVAGLAALASARERLESITPHISIWCVATVENLAELPDLVRLAGRIGVPEVYVQRMVYFADDPGRQFGMARAGMSVFGELQERPEAVLAECEALSAQFGVAFHASGAGSARASFAAGRPAEAAPWQACVRPWTSAYVTAHGTCLPCCISPFASQDYAALILGNLFRRPFGEIWDGAPYRQFRSRLLTADPHPACAGCGVHWSL